MPRDVDHIVHAPEDAKVAVGGQDRCICGEVGPVAPILALRILAVFRVVLAHEPFSIAPDRLEDPGPGIPDADVTGLAGPGFHLLTLFIVDDRENAGHSWTRAAGLHRVEGGFGAAEEAAILCLPPGIHDHGLALPDDAVVPLPDLGLDRLAHRRHVLESVGVLLRFVGAGFTEHPDSCRRGVEDVDVQLSGDAPGPSW